MDKKALDQAKTFIFSDVEREIQLAKASQVNEATMRSLGSHPGAGTFLRRLASSVARSSEGNSSFGGRQPRRTSIGFVDCIGPDYKAFRASFKRQNEVYDVFRCGLAQEYYVKKSCVIAMLSSDTGPGIGRDSSRRFFFVVESYCRDLKRVRATWKTAGLDEIDRLPPNIPLRGVNHGEFAGR